jgi:farnesyl-diphosphate farnesyltransferase
MATWPSANARPCRTAMDAFTAQHLAGVSRTYAILIPMLPRNLAEPVGLAYLLMRIVDTLEDAPELSPEQRRALFGELQAVLAAPELAVSGDLARPIGETGSERALMQDIPEVLARIRRLAPAYRAPLEACALKMIGGVCRLMNRSAERGRPYPSIRDAAELRQYCYYVAGVVGEMLCAMMAHYLGRPALMGLSAVAVELGIGLQLVNILKDALKDAEQGRRYLPMADGHVSPAEIYRAVLAEARQCLARGTEFVLALPAQAAGLRSFCGLPIAWGALTLARAERDARQAKISRGVIQASIARFKRLAGNDQALRRWFRLLLGSAHDEAAA